MSTLTIPTENVLSSPTAYRRSISRLLAPLDKIAGYSANLVVRRTSQFEIAGERHEIPSYVFIGPEANHRPVKIGIFAGLHGDELEGTLAILFLVQLLEAVPEVARGYVLFLYPVGNPSGYEDDTHLTRQGFNLNREFWRGSTASEVRVLEGELKSQAFDGIITLHSHEPDDTFAGYSPQPIINERLVTPALRAVEAFVKSSGRTARLNPPGNISRQGKGSFGAGPVDASGAFEITLDAPEAGAAWLLTAVLAILDEHKKTTISALHS